MAFDEDNFSQIIINGARVTLEDDKSRFIRSLPRLVFIPGKALFNLSHHILCLADAINVQ